MAGGFAFHMGAKKGPKLAVGLKGQQKSAKAPALFAADSDDDEPSPSQDSKRQRTAPTGPCSSSLRRTSTRFRLACFAESYVSAKHVRGVDIACIHSIHTVWPVHSRAVGLHDLCVDCNKGTCPGPFAETCR